MSHAYSSSRHVTARFKIEELERRNRTRAPVAGRDSRHATRGTPAGLTVHASLTCMQRPCRRIIKAKQCHDAVVNSRAYRIAARR